MIWLPIVGNYCEIDAYASILAYADLLNQRHKPAKTYIPFTPNYSVPTELRIKDLENTHFDMRPDDQAIILDVSVPEAINRLVPLVETVANSALTYDRGKMRVIHRIIDDIDNHQSSSLP